MSITMRSIFDLKCRSITVLRTSSDRHVCVCVSLYVGKRRYSVRLWKTFTDCFNCLPVAAIISEKIFCMHGGT